MTGKTEEKKPEVTPKAEVKKETPKAGRPADLLIKDHDFAVPGDEIVNSMDYLPGRNTFREGNSIIAKRIGIVSTEGRVISVIQFNGVYMPRFGDMVVGEVVDIMNGWVIDINAAFDAFLPLSGVRGYIDTRKTDLASVYPMGSLIYAKVHHVSKDSIHLSMQDPKCRKIQSGNIIKINASKVPRLIGKQGSMINVIKDHTGSRISIGQNGMVWFEGGDENLVVNAVNIVDREAYKEGLTDRVGILLDKQKGKTAKPAAAATEAPKEEKK